MDHFWRETMRVIDRMGTHEWALVMGAMIIVAIVCMRGFGSRSKY